MSNFHFRSLHHSIEPLVVIIHSPWEPRMFRNLSLKLSPQNLEETMIFIEKKWQEFFPNNPFVYYFLDEDFDLNYRSDEQFGQIYQMFTGLTIFIACLGLLGLASFTAEQRTKEIGIRKVLGASVSGIVLMFSKEFTKWVLIANIIAWPIAWFGMNQWLQNFAYQINIDLWTFVIVGGLVLMIELLPVSWQTIRAATANPVEALRYE
jgi:putative ABC transport system permease protein